MSADRLRHIHLKVERAKRHRAELEGELSKYLESGPYKIGVKRAEDDRPVYHIVSAAPVPDFIALSAGDALQNLMSALDHLAYQLVAVDAGGTPPNPNWTYFPIADDKETYEAKKAGKMRGAAAATLDAVDTLRPYRGGNDTLWKLYRLNNIEKHRLLFTVGSQAAGIHLGQLLTPFLAGSFPPEAIELLSGMDHYLVPADRGFPLLPGFELYIGAPGEPANEKLQFRFTVVLDEPGIAEGEPILELVDTATGAVEEAVARLSPRIVEQ
jgi:hypothetical protein